MAIREISEQKLEAVYDNDVKTGYVRIVEIACNSGDTKPTEGLANGSTCIEVDTGDIYLWDEEGEEWVKTISLQG